MVAFMLLSNKEFGSPLMIVALAKLSFAGCAWATLNVKPARTTNPSFTKPALRTRLGHLKPVNFFIISFIMLLAAVAFPSMKV
jgi:hypothetical protein